MPFSEDDLRKALRRKDPSPDFTRRVMARLNERNAMNKTSARENTRTRFFWFLRLRLAPALGFALALVLALGAWIGYQSYQQHEQQAKNAEHQRILAEERAKRETLLALKITSEKLNHVLRKVNGAMPQDVRIRRERL